MKAYAYRAPHTLADFQIDVWNAPEPELQPNDVLVRVKATGFNPVDYKIRHSVSPVEGREVILGWDAAGVIEQVGSAVQGFKVGDAVFYSGDRTRDGSYAELQAVDHRLIAKKPESLDFVHAAALPLTSVTAWEALFERGVEYTADSKVLIVGGAGGVGSMAIQLLKALTQATVIVTASREATVDWCKRMGADHVIGRDLEAGLKLIGVDAVDVVFSTTHSGQYLTTYPTILRPFGHLMLIDDPQELNIVSYKRKSLSVHWEYMFAKSEHGYKPETQGVILREVAKLVDSGKVQSTWVRTVPSSAEGIREAHVILESASSIGKLVMEMR